MMIKIVARCALLAIMCLALVYYQKADDHTVVLYEDHPNYYSDDERYLVADDDRHNNGPNENNVTNFPTIFGFSRAPSTSPTVITLSPSPTVRPSFSSAPSMSPTSSSSPTMIPSALPSQYPSLSPSISLQPSVSMEPSMVPSLQPSVSAKPSSIPTSMPSLDACKAYDGVFGNVNAVDKVRVSFNYGIETDMTIQNTLSSQIFSVEAELLNLLIQQLILPCQSIDTSLILSADTLDNAPSMTTSRSSLESFSPTFAPSIVNTNAPSGSPTESIVGLSSRPVDVPFGAKCLASFQEGDCNIVEGKMDVYLSPNVNATDTRILLRRTIKAIMDAGLLNDCHPAILSVIWIDLSSEVVDSNNNNEIDDDATTIDPISIGSMSTWMFIAGSVVFVMVVGVVTRYRYYRVKEGKYYKEDDTESYIDVLTQNGSLPSEKRRSSLQSEIPFESIMEDRVPSVQSSRSSQSSFHGFSWWDKTSELSQHEQSLSSQSGDNLSHHEQLESVETGNSSSFINDEKNVSTPSSSRQQRIAEIRAKLRNLEDDIGSHFSK